MSAAIAGPVGPDGGHHPDSGPDPGAYIIPAYINALVFRDQVNCCQSVIGLLFTFNELFYVTIMPTLGGY